GRAPSWLLVPLPTHQGALGAMALRSRPDAPPYTAGDKELLQFISTQVATAVERKRLHERLQYLAQNDPLTGLPNRGVLLDRLDMALKRARRGNARIALLYLDLDEFKRVNDSLGHVAGDVLLQTVALRLRQTLRDVDTVARMGGDEFVMLLEDVGAAGAALVADKIRDAVRQPIAIDGCQLRIRPSIGIAVFPEQGDDAAALLKQADAAMYADKQASAYRLEISPDT
ncbi:MAG: diguanylate cyclase domain-containing protein, partial [Burkholderiaceae bacterium]